MSIRPFNDINNLPLTSEEKTALSTFDAEVARGIIHSGNWVCLMSKLRALDKTPVAPEPISKFEPREFLIVQHHYGLNAFETQSDAGICTIGKPEYNIIHVREVWDT